MAWKLMQAACAAGLLASAAFMWPRRREEECTDCTAFVQTFRTVTHPEEREALIAGNATTSARRHSAPIPATCPIHYMPLSQRVMKGSLEFFGYDHAVERQMVCRPYGSSSSGEGSAWELFGVSSGGDNAKTWIIPIVFVAAYVIVLLRMLVNILFLQPSKAAATRPSNAGTKVKETVRRPEEESWNRGLIGWLSVDWANDWVARWGNSENSDQTRISIDDLDALGDPEDETDRCYNTLTKYWAEEVARRGKVNASIISVMIRFITFKRLFKLSAWTAGYEAVMYLGPPLVMDWTVKFYEYLYTRRLQGDVVSQQELAVPTIMIICFFTGVPLFMIVCNTMSTLLSQRISVRTCGALSALCLEKAQRLPLSSPPDQEKAKDAKEAKAAKGAPEAKPEKQADKPAEGGDEPEDDQDAGVDDSKEGMWIPKQFNLVHVVANDVNTCIVMIPMYLSKVCLQIPVLFIMLATLWSKIRWTLLLTILAAFIFGVLFLKSGIQIMYAMLHYTNYAGERLQFLQNVLFSIRTTKACGWETVVAKAIQEKRVAEMQELEKYYWYTGFFYNWLYVLPKALVAVSIWGHCWLYPHAQLNIFALLPGLLTLQSATMALINGLPILINAKASLLRVEGFMKQAEAPTGRPKCEGTPPWLTVWPERDGEVDRATVRVQGDFAREADGEPVLRGLDITVPAGESLAVLGQVGSGKSTLLHAVLGELYPSGDTRLEVSEMIAYSSQVPYICEGTLRGNVFFGESVAEGVYQEAIFAAGLLPDIATLPGGEDVQIGGRGISLSGGQKARVSMARVACSRTTPVVLIDDPFSALDSHTAQHVLTHLVHGEGLRGRTRIVVTQPDAERICNFNQVLILVDGKVAVQGTPDEVMQTPEYAQLLSSQQREALQDDEPHAPAALAVQATPTPRRRPDTPATGGGTFQLRDEEFQGRVDFASVHYFCKIGRYPYIIACVSLFLLMNVFFLLMNVVLQDWSTEQVAVKAGVLDHKPRTPLVYFFGYSCWWVAGILTWFMSWTAGVVFTLRLSGISHMALVERLLHAPVDRFFDKTPVGRIMNRMSTDLQNIDMWTFNKITQFIGMVWTFGVPISYVHVLLPMYFTLAALPFYFLVGSLVRRFWLTMVPMKYLTHVCKSQTDAALTEVEYSNPVVRGFQKTDFRLAEFLVLISSQLKADINTKTILLRWLLNRLLFMAGFYTTCIALLALWIPGLIDFGGIGLCLSNMFTIITSMESYMEGATNAQFQFISMNRLYEYTELLQEKPARLAEDSRYANITATIRRSVLKGVTYCRDSMGAVVVARCGAPPGRDLLVQTPRGDALIAGPHESLRNLDTTCEELQEADDWHRITAVNGVRGDAARLAHEMAAGIGDEVKLEIQSGWLADGTEVVIEDLRIGYGDIPKDVLRDVSLVIPPRSKVGIVGTTGCGKSTFMLALLRILEPRGGRICINGVDTQDLGLEVLRTSIGLVPQDPVIIEGTVRHNLDPFGQFSEDDLLSGLGMVQLRQMVEEMSEGLDTFLPIDGGNLSFGQRQLLCLARVVVRQPALILLDEATSALDPHTQEVVNTTIQGSFPESTLVVIAHRLETIMNFDLIVVLHQGEIVEKGSAMDLRDVKGGVFAKMLAAKKQW